MKKILYTLSYHKLKLSLVKFNVYILLQVMTMTRNLEINLNPEEINKRMISRKSVHNHL